MQLLAPSPKQDAVILGTFLEQTFHLGGESQFFFFFSLSS